MHTAYTKTLQKGCGHNIARMSVFCFAYHKHWGGDAGKLGYTLRLHSCITHLWTYTGQVHPSAWCAKCMQRMHLTICKLTCPMFSRHRHRFYCLMVHLAKGCILATIQVRGGLPDDVTEIPELPKVKGHNLEGGPQMIQLRSYPFLTPGAVELLVTAQSLTYLYVHKCVDKPAQLWASTFTGTTWHCTCGKSPPPPQPVMC